MPTYTDLLILFTLTISVRCQFDMNQAKSAESNNQNGNDPGFKQYLNFLQETRNEEAIKDFPGSQFARFGDRPKTTKKPNIFVRIGNFLLSRYHRLDRRRHRLRLSTTATPTATPTRLRGWSKGAWGSIPKEAYLAGITAEGKKLFIGRTMDDNDVIPGSLVAGSHCVRYSSSHYWGRCGKYYEVLVGDSFTWYKGYHNTYYKEYGVIHVDAVEGGHIRTSSGVQRLFVCRAWLDNEVYIGRLKADIDSQMKCFFDVYGLTRGTFQYETLLDPVGEPILPLRN